jgi:hypothetical protein
MYSCASYPPIDGYAKAFRTAITPSKRRIAAEPRVAARLLTRCGPCN